MDFHHGPAQQFVGSFIQAEALGGGIELLLRYREGIQLFSHGHSFLLGTVIGGAVGGAAAYWGGLRIAEVRVLGQRVGGRVAVVGPVRDANFPWIVLDRALAHFESVARRAHAQRDVLEIPRAAHKVGASSRLEAAERSRLGAMFSKMRSRGSPASEESVEALAERVAKLLPAVADDGK